jgi:hypothetical protein
VARQCSQEEWGKAGSLPHSPVSRSYESRALVARSNRTSWCSRPPRMYSLVPSKVTPEYIGRRCNMVSHRKKMLPGFPFPRRDVTYQTLSRRKYVSLIKPEVLPFPSWNSHRILLNQLVFLFAGRSFPGYSSSPGGNSSKIFDNSLVYLFPA